MFDCTASISKWKRIESRGNKIEWQKKRKLINNESLCVKHVDVGRDSNEIGF